MTVRVESTIMDAVLRNLKTWESNRDEIAIDNPGSRGVYSGFWWRMAYDRPGCVAMVRSGKLVLNLTGLR